MGKQTELPNTFYQYTKQNKMLLIQTC